MDNNTDIDSLIVSNSFIINNLDLTLLNECTTHPYTLY